MNRFTIPAKRPWHEHLSVVLVHADKKRGRSSALKKIDNKYLLDIQLEELNKTFGVVDTVVVLGHEAAKTEHIINRRVRVVLNERFEDTDFGHSAMLGIKATLGKACYVIDNTGFTKDVFVPKVESHVYLDEEGEFGAIIQEGVVTHFSYGITPYVGKIFYFCESDVKRYLQMYSDRLLFYEVLNLMVEKNSEIHII